MKWMSKILSCILSAIGIRKLEMQSQFDWIVKQNVFLPNSDWIIDRLWSYIQIHLWSKPSNKSWTWPGCSWLRLQLLCKWENCLQLALIEQLQSRYQNMNPISSQQNCLQLLISKQLKSQYHNNNLKSSQQNWSIANMVFGVTGLIICVGNFIAACLLIHGVREVTTSLNYYVDKEYFDDMLTHHWIFCIKRWAIFQSTFIWSISTLLQANQVLVIPWIVLTIISLIFGLANLIRSIHSLVLFIGLGSTFWRWSSCWSFDQEQTEEDIPSHFQHTLRRSCVWPPSHWCPQSLLLCCCLVTQVSEIENCQWNYLRILPRQIIPIK